MKRQKPNSLENITWSELGKQNIQAKKFEWVSVNSDLEKDTKTTDNNKIFQVIPDHFTQQIDQALKH